MNAHSVCAEMNGHSVYCLDDVCMWGGGECGGGGVEGRGWNAMVHEWTS